MLRVAVRQVNSDRVDQLRSWLAEVDGPRRTEALATLVDEGCSHEQVLLIEGKDGPVVIYLMEVDDVEKSQDAAVASQHAIDAEHKKVMHDAVGEAVHSELLLDLYPPPTET
jgi:hypothetical protein